MNEDYYSLEAEYFADLLKHLTYGILCNIAAAGQLYSFVFEVYRHSDIHI